MALKLEFRQSLYIHQVKIYDRYSPLHVYLLHLQGTCWRYFDAMIEHRCISSGTGAFTKTRQMSGYAVWCSRCSRRSLRLRWPR